MKFLPLLSISLCFILISSPLQIFGDDLPTSEDLFGFVEAQLNLGYRIPGTEGSERFKNYMKDFVTNTSSWNLSFKNFSYMDVEMSNLLITKKSIPIPELGNNSSKFPKLLIGAHFDSRARATKDAFSSDLPVPGANDGASGVAVILGLMLALDDEDVDVGFVLFDGEDQGYDVDYGLPGWSWIQGSTVFAAALSENQVNDMEMFLLLDMIGDKNLQIKMERNSNSTLNQRIWDLAAKLGYQDTFVDTPGYSIIDDHIPFLRRGIPSVDLIDFDFPFHHTVNDNLGAVSGESLFTVFDLTLNWIWEFLGTDPKVTLPNPTQDMNVKTGITTAIIVLSIPMMVFFSIWLYFYRRKVFSKTR
ncbi:MAG: M28 family peptidase [Methanobacteriota archaeon]|nr:MAG: M28 family peptidase [Euryarchaeota archaeon]